MKKKVLITTLCSVCLVLMIVSCTVPAPTPTPTPKSTPTPTPTPTPAPKPTPTPTLTTEARELVVSHLYKAGQGQYEGTKAWMQAVEEKAKGKIKFKVYPGGTLVQGNQELEACGRGLTDVSYLVGGYFESKVPLLTTFTIPWCLRDFEQAKKVYKRALPLIQDPFMKQNVKPVTASVAQEYVLYSTKPIQKLEDMKGLKFRSPGGYLGELVKDNGGGAVTLTGPEAYSALQKGVVDATYLTVASDKNYRLYEVAPYVTRLGLLTPTICLVVVNLNTWNSLPKDVQEAMLDSTDAGVQAEWEANAVEETEVKAMWDKIGRKVYSLPPQERDRWIAFCSKYYDAVVVKVPEAKPIVDIFRDKSLW